MHGETSDQCGVHRTQGISGTHAAALLLLLVYARPCSAADPKAGTPALVVGVGTADGEEISRARDRVQGTTGALVPGDRVFGPDDLVAAMRYRPVTEGALEVFTCKGPTLDQQAFESRLAEVVSRVDQLDLDGAMSGVVALQKDLPCSVSPIAARGLHDVFFFAGLLEAYHGQRDVAIADFARAAALKPDVPWNTAYAPEAHELYLLGKDRAGQPDATLHLVPAADSRRLWIDGVAQADAKARSVTLRPGVHLIHVETDQGNQRAIGLELGAGTALYADVSGAVAAVQDGETDGPRGAAARVLIQVAAGAWNADVVYVAHRAGVTFLRSGGAMETARRPITATGDRLGLRVGGGVLLRGAPSGSAAFVYASPVVEAEIATILGLELVGSFIAGFTSAAPGTWSLLPAGTVGAQWAWNGAAARPYVGVEAGFATLSSPGTNRVGVGPMLRGGVRFTPSRDRSLRLALGGHVGWVGTVTGAVTLTVGFGARPGGPRPVAASKAN